MRKILSYSLLSCLALGLISCRSIIDPTFMPSGYAYHGNEYKAAPGPEANDIGYEYSAEKNEETLAIWKVAVSDLIDQFEQESNLAAQNIYVHRPKSQNAFNASYDHVVREELRARGYNLLTYPGGALELWYEAHEPLYAHAHNKPIYNGDEDRRVFEPVPENRDFILILNLVNDGALLAKTAAMYKLPGYGYKPTMKLKFAAAPAAPAGEAE